MSDALPPGAPDIAYRDGALHVEGVPLARIADAVGTPFYCYSARADRAPLSPLRRRLRRSRRDAVLFGEGQFQPRGDRAPWRGSAPGADVVSEGEFRRALAAGIPASRIVFSGIGKTEAELRLRARPRRAPDQCRIAARARAAERGRERAWARPRRSRSASIPMSMRAPTPRSPPARRKTSSASISPTPPRAYRRAAGAAGHRARRHRRPYRLAAHQPRAVRAGLRAASSSFAAALRAEGIALERLDLGGGLGIRYRDETPPAIEDYAAMVKRAHRQSRRSRSPSSRAAPSSAMPACWSRA